ncbi:uncharacterized protein [Cherax quadricarinatus]|uniref:uncharacterized protein n=1 Tax=Cherax quadricarinatus TaxID=27406 RepID=UPI002378B6AB|nr:uncharacterized protein LOC128696149 [Cherax quadricarinatus]
MVEISWRRGAGVLVLLTFLTAECQQQQQEQSAARTAQYSRRFPTTQVLGGAQRFRQALRIQDIRHRPPQTTQHHNKLSSKGSEDPQISHHRLTGQPEAQQSNPPRLADSLQPPKQWLPVEERPQEVQSLSESQRPSGFPKAQGPLKASGTPRAPGPSKAPGTPRAPGPSKASGAPRAPGTPRLPEYPNAPTLHDGPRAPETLEAPEGQVTSQSPRRPGNLGFPDVPRVPQVPNHLPLDLTNRLQEFPTLAESLQAAPHAASMHSFFEPTIQVEEEELSEGEWQEYLHSEWGSDGVVPRLISTPPPYVVNVNYGSHQCVHLGNTITPAHSAHKPKLLEFPGEAGGVYTVLMVDLDVTTSPYINWLLINVPTDHINKGTELVEYEGPRPAQDSGHHRLVFLVYLQHSTLPPNTAGLPSARSCQTSGREGVDLSQLTRDLALRGPVAGNYFLSEWDVTVEHTCTQS